MNAVQLKALAQARPFRPFTLVLENKRKIHVPNPRFISVSPMGNAANIWHRNGGADYIDLCWIASVTVRKTKSL